MLNDLSKQIIKAGKKALSKHLLSSKHYAKYFMNISFDFHNNPVS